ncbi:hypothetical protein IWZ01DRAFT_175896 [Phyllosticta capitalensis]
MAETTGTAKPDSPPSTDAHQFWGYLFKPNKCGTDLLNRLLAGIANYVASNFGPAEDCTDITPTQLAAFYKAVGGDYDILFLDTPASSIGFIYKSLGCLHSLQPAPDSDGYAIPSIPALKPKGFVTWQTIQLLLGPDEHVPFLQNSVAQFDIVDPATSKIFPKLLPKEAFPEKPDDDMLTWYENVSKRLRQEAERAAKAVEPPKSGVTSPRIEIVDSDGDEDLPEDRTHAAAAAYFRNPLYRNREGRPTIIRRYTRVPDYKARTPREIVQDRGRVVANTLSKHFWTPWGKREEPRRRSPVTRRRSNSPFSDDVVNDFDDDDDDLDPTPTPHRHAHLHPHHSSHSRQTSDPPPPKQPPRPRPQAYRRASSRSTRSLPSSESEDDGPQMAYTRPRPTRTHSQAYNQNVPLRHRRSHSPPGSPREYFPPFHEYTQHQHAQHSRRHSDKEKQNPPHHHASKVHSPHRHATSDPSRPPKDVRERYVERDWGHEAQNSPKRDREPADSPMAGSARPSPRESYMPAPPNVPSASNSAPPTPPPIKTFSGTNLSELAGGGHGPGQRTSGHGAHRRNQTHAPGASMMNSSSASGQLPPGFRPTNGPLFATQVAHMHPTAPITPAAAGNAQPGVDPRVPASANPPVPGGYYSPHAPGAQPHGGSRRPSYPPRSERNTMAGPPPSRGQSLRYAGGSPWGSRNSSLERGAGRERERERDRDRDRLTAAAAAQPHRYVPPGVAVGDGGGGVRRSYAGDGWY